ncbi:PA2778 family cysteine peptidase [Desulfogranum marinum]|uniref:PA2778 family cysteine peptidase n=1 Tax=Desulfogranum marinum TaxID=453220 RepID=UPI0029C6B1AF|nr:PA2778 family cysteine peptidase [Desulfogranum marinum]
MILFRGLLQWACLICILVVSGCGIHPSRIGPPLFNKPIELVDTVFFPQKKYQCGPAALATVLQSSRIDVAPDALASQVYLPGRKGSLQAELMAATRRYGRLPYVIQGTLAGLIAELEAGRPVLVLQDYGRAGLRMYHYAVVVGGMEHTLILRSADEKRLFINESTFLRTWKRAGYWGMVVLQPGQLPATLDREKYLAAAAGLEGAGKVEPAAQCYQALLSRWPAYDDALFGLATVRLAQHHYLEAIKLYRQLLMGDNDNPAAMNNLAEALAAAGRVDQGVQELDRYLEHTDLSQRPFWEKTLLTTRNELQQRLAQISHQ